MSAAPAGAARPPLSLSLAMHRLLLNASRLLCLSCPSLLWTLRCCIPLLLSFSPQSHCVDPSSHLVEHLLEHLHPLLLGHTGLLRHSSLSLRTTGKWRAGGKHFDLVQRNVDTNGSGRKELMPASPARTPSSRTKGGEVDRVRESREG